jgi:hypothetical protein
MNTSEYTLVDADDWVGLYRDGKLVSQGHRFTIRDVFELLNIDLKVLYPDDEWIYERGDLPNALGEVKLHKELNDESL